MFVVEGKCGPRLLISVALAAGLAGCAGEAEPQGEPTEAAGAIFALKASDCPAGTIIRQGTSGNDTLNGTSGNDCILGNGGDDTINGLGGDDYLIGGAGNDTIRGGDGNDRIFGENDADLLYGDAGNDVIDGAAGVDQIWGGIGDDAIQGGSHNDTLRGEAGDDAIAGGGGTNVIDGGTGIDQCTGTGCEQGAPGVTGCTQNSQCGAGKRCVADLGMCVLLCSDRDADGTCDTYDGCPSDAAKTAPGICGCGVSDADGDGDGTASCNDGCPADGGKVAAGICGCGVSDADGDGDGTANCKDGCPNDTAKVGAGACGCGVSDVDSDADGTADCNDGCPNDVAKTVAGLCGCGVSDADGDGDSTPDCDDDCPSDVAKTAPGICGCGTADTDSDDDGTANCIDECPSDASKTAVGACGCGISDTDTDGDATADCNDACASDAGKVAPGVCGCGVSDVDSDGDATPNCLDACEGYPETDSDGDGIPNECELLPVDQVRAGGDTVYMLSRTARRVMRWSVATQRFSSPLSLAVGPQQIAYSAANGLLYVGYASGAITAIDPGTRVESSFATMPGQVTALVPMGTRLFAIDVLNGARGQSVFAPAGTLIERITTSVRPSATYDWSAVHSRIYQARDATSPNDLVYQQFEPATGLRTASGDSPYHGDFLIRHPIRVSADGARVFVGGDVYVAPALTYLRSLPGTTIVDAAWLSDGRLLVLRSYNAAFALLEQYGADLALQNARLVVGSSVAVSSLGNAAAIVTRGTNNLPIVELYTPGVDGDGDGVDYAADRFPLDRAASQDTDRDGHPDGWNSGFGATDSVLALQLDAFPLDAACRLPSEALPTTGECNIAGSVAPYTPSRIELDAQGIVYLLDSVARRIQRYETAAGRYLNPIPIGGDASLLTYSSDNQRLYVAYTNGKIAQIDPMQPYPGPEPFAATAQTPHGLAAAGRFVLAADPSAPWEGHFTFGPNGALISKEDWSNRSLTYSFSPGNGRMYFTRDDMSPNDLMFNTIDPVTGAIVDAGESPYHGVFDIRHPVRASQDGTRVILGSGDVYDGNSLAWVATIPRDPIDATWLGDATLLTLVADGTQTKVEQWSSSLTQQNAELVAGTPLAIRGDESAGIVVITLQSGRPSFHAYTSGDDGDGDGVAFAFDRFPFDAAASTDTDGDRWPDAWNDGEDETTSSTGLLLDAFPLDSACQLVQDAIGGASGTECDIAARVPAYRPDVIAIDSEGVLHMLSTSRATIFRYATATHTHLNPILLDGGATHLTYASDLDRLYLAYPSGQITAVDAGADFPLETSFAMTPLAARGVVAAGPYLLAVDTSDAHFSFDADGALASRVENRSQALDFAFSEANDRVYLIRNLTSPRGIRSEAIAPSSGAIGAVSESPNQTTYVVRAPIRVANGGGRVVVGSGDVYDALTLVRQSVLPVALVDATWAPDDRLFTMDPTTTAQTNVRTYSSALVPGTSFVVTGTPLRMFHHDGVLQVVTLSAGAPYVSSYPL